MDARVAALADILRLNTKLFRNCLDGLTDAAARERPVSGSNNAAFVAAHVADSRFYLLRLLGAEAANPLAYLEDVKSIDDVKQWPTLEEIHAAWTQASHALRERLDSLTAAELDQPAKQGFPMPNATMLGVLTFLVQHDSYHVGQLSLLRRQVGLPAMSYT